MVFITFVHIHGTVEVGIHEQRIVAQSAAYAQVVSHAVAFDIGFINHIDAVLVAKFVETFLLRIVAGTHRVHIIFLPEFEILQHELFRNIMSRVFIMFVNIDTFHKNGYAIHKKLLVLNLDRTETHFAAGGFYHFAVRAFQADDECIEIGSFGCPLFYATKGFLGKFHLGLVAFHTGRRLGDLLVFIIQQTIGHYIWGFDVAFVRKLHFQLQNAVFVVRIQRSFCLEIGNVNLGSGIEINITFYTADAPEVLTLQIVGIRKAVYLNGNHVFASLHHSGYIEAGGSLGILAHAYKLAVDVIESGAAYTIRAHENLFSIPVVAYGKLAAVGTCRVPLLGHVWRIGFVPIWLVALGTKFVRLIDINRCAETLQFPVARYVDIRPAADISTCVHKVRRPVSKIFHVVELPLSIEGKTIGSISPVIDDGIFFTYVRSECTSGRHFVDVGQLRVCQLFVAVLLCRKGEGKQGEAGDKSQSFHEL